MAETNSQAYHRALSAAGPGENELQFLKDLITPGMNVVGGAKNLVKDVGVQTGNDLRDLLIRIFGGKPGAASLNSRLASSDAVDANVAGAIDPLRRTVGMLPSGQAIVGALGGEADDTPQVGALPADRPPQNPPARQTAGTNTPPAVSRPTGALPGTRRPAVAAPQASQAGARPELVFDQGRALPVDTATEAVAGPVEQRESLPDMYRREMANVNTKVNDNLNPQQQDASRRMFYANLMHGGPTATPFDSARTATVASQEYTDKQQAINRAMELGRIQTQRGDVTNITNLTNTEQDNTRADKRGVSDEKHARKLEDLREQELKANNEYRKEMIRTKDDLNAQRAITAEHKERLADIRAARAGAGADPMARTMTTLRGLFPNETNEQLFTRYVGRSTDPGKDERAMRTDYGRERRDAMRDNPGTAFPSFEKWSADIEGTGPTKAAPVKGEKSTVNGKTAIYDGVKWVPQ